MRYLALACDYDGTLALDGRVSARTTAALESLLATERKLILVTGRELNELLALFPAIELFAWVVAENGALLYCPATREAKALAAAPPRSFVHALEERGIRPISVGQVIVATWHPHEATVLATIRDLGLDLQVIFNKGAVMVLPANVSKASGLAAGLKQMGLSPHEVVGIGDAENDHAFLAMCECSVAVANALPAVKQTADLQTRGDHGDGVIELIEQMVADDLQGLEATLTRHNLRIGTRQDVVSVTLASYGPGVLVVGASAGGRSAVAAALMEELRRQQYEFCILQAGGLRLSPEIISLGDKGSAPSETQIVEVAAKGESNVAANLVGLDAADRPSLAASLCAQLLALRARTGRPHWIFLDEAHRLLPATVPLVAAQRETFQRTVLLADHPELLHSDALAGVGTVIAVGHRPELAIAEAARALGAAPPPLEPVHLGPGEALLWCKDDRSPPVVVRLNEESHGPSSRGLT